MASRQTHGPPEDLLDEWRGCEFMSSVRQRATPVTRENKIDDVSAVLRHEVVSTTRALREHGRDDPVP